MNKTREPKILFVCTDDELAAGMMSRLSDHEFSPTIVRTPPSPLQALSNGHGPILFHVRDGAVDDLAALQAWAKSSNSEIIAVLDDENAHAGASVLAHGAISWITPNTPPETLRRILQHGLERHHRRRELEDARRRFDVLIDHAPLGVFEIEDGRVSSAHGDLLRTLGYSREDVLGASPMDLVAPEDRPLLKDALEQRQRGEGLDSPTIYRFVGKDGSTHIGEVRSRPIASDGSARIEGIIRDVTHETRLMQLHRIVLELGEVILGDTDIDRILQSVLDAITEHGGFRRAVLSLYDLSYPVPFEGPIYKLLASGLTPLELELLKQQKPMPVAERRMVYAERFRLGPAYYIPHTDTPWSRELGIAGNVSTDSWHKDDYLFLPLRGVAGIIGSISVDDPVERSVPTIASILPVASLANFAALAVERVFKIRQLQTQKERLRGLSNFARELAGINDVSALCKLTAQHVCNDLGHDYCGVWVIDGREIVLSGVASAGQFAEHEIYQAGTRFPMSGGGITRETLATGETIVVQDVEAEPRYRRTRDNVRSMVAVPIIGRKGVLAGLDVESQRIAAFAEDDVEVLSALASELSVTISGLHWRHSLERVYAFGQRVAAAVSVQQVVAGTLDFLADHFDYEMSALFLEQDGKLAIAGTRGPYEAHHVHPGWTFPEDQGIAAWVARHKRHALVNDTQEDPRYFAGFPGTRSELAVPILFSDRLLGVLNIESPQVGFFDDEDRQLLAVIANHIAIALSNLASQQDLREQAIRDPLTGLYNRHYFNSMIAPELSRSDRYIRPITLMMIDVDGFRAVNNRLGHLKGDEVLQQVAKLLSDNVRSADRVIRYGGDEFLVFMPETVDEGVQVAERLRERIGSIAPGTENEEVAIGLSIGIYTRHPQDAHTLEEILEETDRRMYADKRARHAERADDYLL